MRELQAGRTLTREDLPGLYAYPDPVPPGGYVKACMLSTLDGAVHGADGRARSISDPDDVAVLSTLRGLSDVVLVGAGTARIEEYRPTEPNPRFQHARAAAGQAASPALAVVTARGQLSPALTAGPGVVDGVPRVLALTCADAPGLADLQARLGAGAVLVCGQDRVDLTAAVSALAGLGLRRVVCEGGPKLLAAVAAAGLLDELCLSWSPLLVGSGASRILDGVLPQGALRLEPTQLLVTDSGFVFGRWQRPQPAQDREGDRNGMD